MCHTHDTADIRHDRKQMFNRRHQAVETCIDHTFGRGDCPAFDKARYYACDLCVVDPAVIGKNRLVLSRGCSEELFVLTPGLGRDFAE